MMYRCLIVASVMLATSAQAQEPAPSETKQLAWKAGAASVKITPQETLWMAGYSARKKPADGMAQDLYVKTLALEDDAGQRFVILTMDFIGVPRSLREAVAARCLSERGIKPEYILMNASHTHCGPSLSSNPGFEENAARYRKSLEDAMVDAVTQAIDRLAPASLVYAHGRCGFAMNRRRPVDGVYKNSPFSDGPVDHDVPVLCVRDANDKVIALAFGYACHATTVFSTTLPPAAPTFLYAGDYPGFAQAVLQEAYPGAVALFVNGCSGDQNPYPRNGEMPGKLPLEMAEYHGRSLAHSVVAALLSTNTPVRGRIRAQLGEVSLDRLEGKSPHSYLLQAIKLGDGLTMVALGSETVVDYSLRLKREIKAPAVWIAGYSNEMVGYISSRRVAAEGGYEAGAGFAPDTEERIIGKIHELLGKVGGEGQ